MIGWKIDTRRQRREKNSLLKWCGEIYIRYMLFQIASYNTLICKNEHFNKCYMEGCRSSQMECVVRQTRFIRSTESSGYWVYSEEKNIPAACLQNVGLLWNFWGEENRIKVNKKAVKLHHAHLICGSQRLCLRYTSLNSFHSLLGPTLVLARLSSSNL